MSVNNSAFYSCTRIPRHRRPRSPLMVEPASQWFKDTPAGTEPDEAAYAALAAGLVVHAREVKAARADRHADQLRGFGHALALHQDRTARAQDGAALYKDAILDRRRGLGQSQCSGASMRNATSKSVHHRISTSPRWIAPSDAEGNIVRVERESVQVYLSNSSQRTLVLSAADHLHLTFLLGFPDRASAGDHCR